jgi:hypothetical protein
MRDKFWKACALAILVYASIVACVSLLTGCQHADITVPYNAPLMLSQDETLHSPYVRQHQTWVQVNGTVARHKGDEVVTPAATQPTK